MDVPAWYIDADAAVQVIARNAARKSRMVIDYEHQTLYAAQNGQPAPASGWVESMEWRNDGLYAAPDWTKRAAAMIDADEYRYISPVFIYDKTGRVIEIKLVGLTNNPGLDGLTDLAALSALIPTLEDSTMNEIMERLRYLLNLPLTTTPEEMAAELDKLKAMITGAGAASLTAYLDTQTTQIAALKASAPDPALFVPVATMTAMQAQIATLTAQLNTGEVGDLVDAALTAGRLLPAQEAWARDLGKTNIAALRSYLDTAPQIAALTATQTGGENLGGKTVNQQSDAEVAVCKALGLTADQFAAGKVEE